MTDLSMRLIIIRHGVCLALLLTNMGMLDPYRSSQTFRMASIVMLLGKFVRGHALSRHPPCRHPLVAQYHADDKTFSTHRFVPYLGADIGGTPCAIVWIAAANDEPDFDSSDARRPGLVSRAVVLLK